jgi:hypothetical protein
MATDGKSTVTENPEGTQPGSQEPNAVNEARFSQSDLDERVKKIKADQARAFSRKEEELKKSVLADYLESLGLDTEDLQATTEKIKNTLGSETASKALENKLERERKARIDVEAKLSQLLEEKRETTLKSEFMSSAAGLSVDPDLLYTVARAAKKIGFVDDQVVVLGSDGSPDAGKKIADVINEIFTEKPYLKKPSTTVGSGSRSHATSSANGSAEKNTSKEWRLRELSKIYGG